MTTVMHVACKYHDSLRGNPRLVEMTRVVECQDSCREMPREMPRLVSWKNFFHGKPRIFTRKILRGTMRVHACKSEVINEQYCNKI